MAENTVATITTSIFEDGKLEAKVEMQQTEVTAEQVNELATLLKTITGEKAPEGGKRGRKRRQTKSSETDTSSEEGATRRQPVDKDTKNLLNLPTDKDA